MSESKKYLLFSAAIFLFSSDNLSAQHATAFDVIDGKQAYQQFCANCHGPDGDLVANVDIGHGIFRQPYDDEQLVGIISSGIPNTPMPGNPAMAETQVLQIVSYLRSLAMDQDYTLAGNLERGQALFNGKGNCDDCHRINGMGSGLGPDLSRIGRTRTGIELMESLLEPQAQIQPGNRFYSVVTSAGEIISGRLLNHDAFSVQLLDEGEMLRSFQKSNLRQFGFTGTSMPTLRGLFDEQEVADLVEYLISLRGEQ